MIWTRPKGLSAKWPIKSSNRREDRRCCRSFFAQPKPLSPPLKRTVALWVQPSSWAKLVVSYSAWLLVKPNNAPGLVRQVSLVWERRRPISLLCLPLLACHGGHFGSRIALGLDGASAHEQGKQPHHLYIADCVYFSRNYLWQLRAAGWAVLVRSFRHIGKRDGGNCQPDLNYSAAPFARVEICRPRSPRRVGDGAWESFTPACFRLDFVECVVNSIHESK